MHWTDLAANQTILRQIDASIRDVSRGGARLEIDPTTLGEIGLESNILSIRIPAGPLAGIKDEVKLVHQLSCKDVITLGIAWNGSSKMVSERIVKIAA